MPIQCSRSVPFVVSRGRSAAPGSRSRPVPEPSSTVDVVGSAVVVVTAKVAIRDDRIALIANDLVVPDFSNAQVNRPLAVSLRTRQCTIDKVSALKQVLAQHPGTSQVHLRLLSGDRITGTLCVARELDIFFRDMRSGAADFDVRTV